jgi:5'-3' exonuclease
MGIPSFFRTIIEKNSNVITGASVPLNVDYFFIDFNSIIYNTFQELEKSNNIENDLIETIIKKLGHLINDIVKPKIYAYISIDGVAPRAKMVQQRSRRYKSVFYKELIQKKEKELNIESKNIWDPAPNISPGTEFMEKLQNKIKYHLSTHYFKYKTFLNDCYNIGEGEHKFLHLLRNLKNVQNNIVIYSPDGDMISLSLLTHQPNIYIMRIPDSYSEIESRFLPQEDYIYCNCNLIRKMFQESLQQNENELKVLNDYNFLLFLVGNDFISSLPFLKIKSGGLDLLIKIYNQLRPNFNDYLILYDQSSDLLPIINLEFFKELMKILAQTEQREMKKIFDNLSKDQYHPRHRQRYEKESSMSLIDIYSSRYQHLNYFHPDHPEYKLYKELLYKINFKEPEQVWKKQYYDYFFDSNVSKSEIIINYLESLMFTLKYYLKGCPSYSWHYKYRVAPFPSDIYEFIKNGFNINDIQFKNDKIYTPFTQLMLILPPQMSFLLPKTLQEIFIDCKYYKTDFQIDVLAGLKYIYCEAILPEIDDDYIINEIEKRLIHLNDKEQQRNKIHKKLFSFKI